MAGYSGTPLAKKLGIKPGHRVAVLGAPDEFEEWVAPLPDDVVVRADLRAKADVVIAFFDDRAAFSRKLASMSRAIFPDGGLWISWPKKSSGVPTDITEDVVREVALPTGLVDNKVCAVSDVWSGLRLVYRRERR